MKEKVTAGTIARTLCLMLALVNQCLTMAGVQIIPIDDETINTLITTGFTVVASLVAWWKNNSFSQKAIKLDKELHESKKVG